LVQMGFAHNCPLDSSDGCARLSVTSGLECIVPV
jgi:hypothetical protein